jgi:hypothetical protein
MPRLATRDERTKRSEGQRRRPTRPSDDEHGRRIGYLTAVTALVTALATLIAATATVAALFIA